MKKSRYSAGQIVRILREADSAPIADVAKRHAVSDASILHGWPEAAHTPVAGSARIQLHNGRSTTLCGLSAT